jgi:hypothetical protein
MKYRAIIHEAWSITQTNKKLIWAFAFVPAVLTTIVSMVYLTYQVAAFYTSPYLNPSIPEDKHALTFIFHTLVSSFQSNPGMTVFFLIMAALVVIAYLLVPVFTQGALIQTLARLRAGQDLPLVQSVTFGFTRFLQLLEYNLAIKSFSLVSLLGDAAFAFRNLGPSVFSFVGWIFLLAIIVGLGVTLLFTYAEFYIVIDKEGVVSSMLKSSGLVIRQWHHTLFMLLLMSIIILRVILNLLVALVIPALVIAPFLIFTSMTFTIIGVVVGSILALVALYFTSYFLGIFHMFVTGVWTFTFLELTASEQNDINLHEAAVHQ